MGLGADPLQPSNPFEQADLMGSVMKARILN